MDAVNADESQDIPSRFALEARVIVRMDNRDDLLVRTET
jgi:hypothetical protein